MAVLKIEAEDLETAEFGDSDGIQSGDPLYLLSYIGELEETTVKQAEDALAKSVAW